MNYYLSPPEATSWTMSPSEFAQNLTRSWPDAKVQSTTNPELSPEWEICMPGGILLGRFYPRLSGVVFNGSTLDDLINFALWYRSLVPAEQPLLFYEEGFNWDMDLRPEATKQEILAALKRR